MALHDPYDPTAFRAGLAEHGFLLPGSVRGLPARGAKFETLLERFDALVMQRAAADGAEPLHFPPLVARALVERLGYLGNFPQLVGSVHSFFGDEAAARVLATRGEQAVQADAAANGMANTPASTTASPPADQAAGPATPAAPAPADTARWEDLLAPTETMLLPAACYPVYPLFSGLLPEGGRLVTVRNWCYRHEPSDEPTRLQSFRMREFIRVGAPAAVQAWRDDWLARGLALLQELGLPATSDVAHDPFFGRSGRMMAASQRDQRLKFEIVVPVISAERPTAVCSFNWHQEHFTATFGIRRHDGRAAHTACLGFGLERVTLALIKTHGFDPASWPAEVRAQLWS